MHFDDLLRTVPKAELHCHFMGAIRHSTLAEFTRRNGDDLPARLANGFHFSGFAEFIEVLRLTTRAMRSRDDFARVAYEIMVDGLADANVVHRELYVEAGYHLSEGIPLEVVVGGVADGLRRAERDFEATSRIILGIDRELSDADAAVDLVRRTIDLREPLVAGIGLSGPEGAGPPELFADAFRLAAREGLHRTNHVCEDNQPLELAPAANYLTSRDVLLCERYDHGNNLVHDPATLAEAARDGASFAVATFPSTEARRAGRWASIKRMVDAGVRITINSDDPTMFGITVAECYLRLFAELGWGVPEARTVVIESFAASWLDAESMAARILEVEAVFARYLAEHAA